MSHPQPKYLFDGLDEVRRQLERRERIALFLDLDGTLAPIAPTPAMVQLEPQTRTVLQSLVENESNPIAIVSGRGIDDLKNIVKLPGIIYAGNHGLEIAGPGLEFLHPKAKDCMELIAGISKTLASQLSAIKGAMVEFKRLTASIHYRLAADHDFNRIRTAVNEAVQPFEEQVRITEGRRVVEIRPAVEWNKGYAVRWILKQIGIDETATIYIGDDKTDEDAFRALPKGITIHVGTFNWTSARFLVGGPDDVVTFMQHLPAIAGPASLNESRQ